MDIYMNLMMMINVGLSPVPTGPALMQEYEFTRPSFSSSHVFNIERYSIEIFNGTIGAGGAPWRLYDDGTLIVESGFINHIADVSPLIDYNDYIVRIVFEGPITAGNNIRGLFARLTNLEEVEGLEYFDISNTRIIASMFANAPNVRRADGLSGWDTSNITNMGNMFQNANSIDNLDLSNWNTSNVTAMSSMFNGASSLSSLDLSGWDTSNVVSMANLFLNAHSLTTIGDISNWNTSNVGAMNSMFNGARSLEELDLSNFDTSRVANMTSMFQNTMSLTTKGDISNWDTSSVTNMSNMFNNSSGMTELDLSNWDTSNVTLMNSMFLNVRYLEKLNIDGWDTSNVTNKTNKFFGTHSLRKIVIGEGFNVNPTNPNLPNVPNNEEFTGFWQDIGDGTAERPRGDIIKSSYDLMHMFDSEMAATFVWQTRSRVTLDVPYEIVLRVRDVLNIQGMLSAYDQNDGDITSDIITEGMMSTDEPGVFYLTHQVTNRQGYMATGLTRIVVLEEELIDGDYGYGYGNNDTNNSEEVRVPDTLATSGRIVLIGIALITLGLSLMIIKLKNQHNKVEVK